MIPCAFVCSRIYLQYSEEAEPEEVGNSYISTVWNDSLTVPLGTF